MTLLVMQFSPFSCHFPPVRPTPTPSVFQSKTEDSKFLFMSHMWFNVRMKTSETLGVLCFNFAKFTAKTYVLPHVLIVNELIC
jgi:hypothetical protein